MGNKTIEQKHSENYRYFINNFNKIYEKHAGNLVVILNKKAMTLDDKLNKKLRENPKLNAEAYKVYILTENQPLNKPVRNYEK